MLKLERRSKNNQIEISIRLKEKCFTKEFYLAFCAALIFHLIGAMLFQVSSLKISATTWVFPPAIVDSDLLHLPGGERNLVLALQENEASLAHFHYEPMFSKPDIPRSPKRHLEREAIYEKPLSSHTNSFVRIDSGVFEMAIPHLALFEHRRKFATVLVAGPLGEKELLTKDVSQCISRHRDFKSLLGNESQFKVVFAVKVDGKTGCVFWYEQKNLTPYDALNRLSEKIIADLRFHQDADEFVTDGEIELCYDLKALSEMQ